MDNSEQAVLSAAARLVAAFGSHDTTAYFAAFAPEATFIFHNLDRRLTDRAAYEAEWQLWEARDGFHVRACRSRDQHVQFAGPLAIFTHSVSTDLTVGGEDVTTEERETIVFQRQDSGDWLAVHEHLSART